jgi:hypothetical protein
MQCGLSCFMWKDRDGHGEVILKQCLKQFILVNSRPKRQLKLNYLKKQSHFSNIFLTLALNSEFI